MNQVVTPLSAVEWRDRLCPGETLKRPCQRDKTEKKPGRVKNAERPESRP